MGVLFVCMGGVAALVMASIAAFPPLWGLKAKIMVVPLTVVFTISFDDQEQFWLIALVSLILGVMLLTRGAKR